MGEKTVPVKPNNNHLARKRLVMAMRHQDRVLRGDRGHCEGFGGSFVVGPLKEGVLTIVFFWD